MKNKLALLALLSMWLALPALAQQTATGSYTATVLPADITLTPSGGGLPGVFKVGLAYTTSVAIAGGTAPFTAVVSSGALPAGLKLSVAGTAFTIAGTPTALCSPSPCTFTVMVTDSSPVLKSATFPKAGTTIK